MENVIISYIARNGVHIDFPSYFAISVLPYLWDDEKNHQICFLAPSQWAQASKRDEFGSMLASADLVLPCEGTLPQKSYQKGAESERIWPVPFIHQMLLDALYESGREDKNIEQFIEPPQFYNPRKVLTLLLSSLEKQNGSMFLLGGRPLTRIKAEKNIRATYPGITLVGSMHGQYQPQEEPALVQAIQKGAPNLILVGDPLPEGERWIPRHMHTTRAGIFVYYGPIMRWFAG